ncbi:hypothetical protein GCM10022292_29620 [Winogradskyella damuponensis]|uniref:Uncharacterized protein n=1 Tax=Winogradskyella damuponensis TaxID=943939 RepID=A0ABP8D0W7_9FLAO
MLEPITFPNAMSDTPSKAACKLTNNSGAEVAKDTTVIPITSLDNLSLKDKPTAALTKKSPPITNNAKPAITRNTLIPYIYYLLT